VKENEEKGLWRKASSNTATVKFRHRLAAREQNLQPCHYLLADRHLLYLFYYSCNSFIVMRRYYCATFRLQRYNIVTAAG